VKRALLLVPLLVAAAAVSQVAKANTSPVFLTGTSGSDAQGPFVTLSWAPAPSNVNHLDLYRADNSARWDTLPRTQTSFVNRDRVVAGATYTYSLYACSGSAECKISSASDTVASDTTTVTVSSTPTPTPTPSPTPSPTPTPTPPPTQTCDVTSTPGESFSSLMGRRGSGTQVCVTAGTYSWGEYVIPSGVTIKGSTDAGTATVFGQAHVDNSGVTAGGSHAVVDGKASNFVGQYLNIDSNLVGGVQGMIVGGASSPAPSNFKVLHSVIHGQRGGGSLTPSQVHGIYWQNGSGSGNEIGNVWVYDFSGYGLHFYDGGTGTPSTNVDIHNVVIDNGLTGRGILFDGPRGNTLHDSVLTNSGPVLCRQSGNTVTNVRSEAGFTGCTGTGLVTADTTYTDEAARNYGNATTGPGPEGPRF
jgi:hypothetical protein